MSYLTTGLPTILLCVAIQTVFVSLALHYYRPLKAALHAQGPLVGNFLMLSAVMLLTLAGNMLQIAIWGLLFIVLGEFAEFSIAFYHSAVNFSTLGYGDMVMTERWRLLGPIEAANGILMFGLSTAVLTATVADLIKNPGVMPAD